MKTKLRIITCGMVGSHPLGGVAWDYFHYLLALAELGHDVYYHEDTWCWVNDPVLGYPTDASPYAVDYFTNFFDKHAPHLKDRWHYFHLHDQHFGMTKEQFDEVARTADVFLNVSGASMIPDQLNPRAIKVFMDTDPGYNQIVMATKPSWSKNVEGWIQQVRDHDRHLTYAENIFGDDCLIPRFDFDWRPTRCVVTLEPWRQFRDRKLPPSAPYTTVMSWTYFKGPLIWNDVEYGAKAPEFERFIDLPKHVNLPLTVAAAGYHKPTKTIDDAGWLQVEAKAASLTPQDYLDFIANSAGEWSIAKNCYVGPRTGWFSCRTACYLAAGKPAVVQDTGWSKFVPAGQGVLAFTTMEEAVAGLEAVAADPVKHRAAAYDIAREYLAPDRVLPPMLETIFSTIRNTAHLPPSQSPLPGPPLAYRERE